MDGKLIKDEEYQFFLTISDDDLKSWKGNVVKLEEGHNVIAAVYHTGVAGLFVLSLMNCKLIEVNRDIEKKCLELGELNQFGGTLFHAESIKLGYALALDDLSMNLFGKRDLENALKVGEFVDERDGQVNVYNSLNDYLLSKQKTEWDVTFDINECDTKKQLILKLK